MLEKIVNVTFGPTIGFFDQKTIDQSFKYGISNDADRMVKSKKISLYCFNPSFGYFFIIMECKSYNKDITILNVFYRIRALLQLGVQSIIITSGTLSPLKTFIHELGLPEPVTLENGHIARKCQASIKFPLKYGPYVISSLHFKFLVFSGSICNIRYWGK